MKQYSVNGNDNGDSLSKVYYKSLNLDNSLYFNIASKTNFIIRFIIKI